MSIKEDTTNRKKELTEEERNKLLEKYYKWVESFYPVNEFEIEGVNGDPVKFIRSNPMPFDENEKKHLIYFIKENNGEKDKIVATIWAFLENKQFNFLIDEYDAQKKGYGTTIYKNVDKILEILGIEDRDDYYVTVAHQEDHPFLKHMIAKDLVEKTYQEPNAQNAREILTKFSNNPYEVMLKDINAIVEYAKKSEIPEAEITESLNKNGFNIYIQSMNEEEIEKFRKFQIPNLKATAMHKTLMRTRDFELLELIGDDIDEKDVTLEFKTILQELKDVREKKEGYAPYYLEKFGELQYIILSWKHVPSMFQNLDENIKKTVKKSVITQLDCFTESDERDIQENRNRLLNLKTLAESMPLDKDDFINMYLKMLNLGYSLGNFKHFVSRNRIFKESVIQEADREIAQNSYYPAPKANWENNFNRNNKIRRINMKKPKNKDSKQVRADIKDAVLKQGTAKKKKIKTDMKGITKEGEIIQVNNLKDWLFGVPGAPGNLKVTNNSNAILLPAQTPDEAVKLIKEIIEEKFYSGQDVR